MLNFKNKGYDMVENNNENIDLMDKDLNEMSDEEFNSALNKLPSSNEINNFISTMMKLKIKHKKQVQKKIKNRSKNKSAKQARKMNRK